MKKRILTTILASLLTVTLMAGCAGGGASSKTTSTGGTPSKTESTTSGTPSEATATITYPLADKPELSIAWETNSGALSHMTDWTYSDYFKWWQEDTGVKLTMTFPADYSLLFGSGEYPDMVFYQWSTYTGGASKAVSDGIIVELDDDLLRKNAPDYYNVITSDEKVNRALKDADGKYYSFAYVRDDVDELATNGIWTRADWLKKLNVKLPQTLDEFSSYCYKLKNDLGVKSVISVPSAYLRNYIFSFVCGSAYGIPNGDWYQIDGKVHYGPNEDGFKQMLKTAHQWYADGIIDKDFQTVDTTVMFSNFLSGTSGVMFGWGSRMQSMLTEMSGKDFDIAAIPSLVKSAGDTAMFNGRDQKINTYGTAITTACKNVEAACKFLNYNYTEKGNILANFGRENVSFTYDSNKKVSFINDALNKNSIYYYTMAGSQGCYIRQKEVSLSSVSFDQIVDAYDVWNKGDTETYRFPFAAAIRTDESDEFSSLDSEIGTYIGECFVKFITGEMDVDTQWSTYLSTLKDMKLERAIEIKQHALDDYYAR